MILCGTAVHVRISVCERARIAKISAKANTRFYGDERARSPNCPAALRQTFKTALGARAHTHKSPTPDFLPYLENNNNNYYLHPLDVDKFIIISHI